MAEIISPSSLNYFQSVDFQTKASTRKSWRTSSSTDPYGEEAYHSTRRPESGRVRARFRTFFGAEGTTEFEATPVVGGARGGEWNGTS